MEEKKIRIKILEYYVPDYNYDCSYCETSPRISEESSWDLVTYEEFKILQTWMHDHNKTNHSIKIVIATEKSVDIPQTVKDYLDKAKKIIEDKKERERKKLEKAEKRQKTLEKKKKDEELRLLKELQNKYKVSV
ncbi:hypothetical protein C4577_04290 [Candidatus Parcubacteria bacterium]|nr:MAG: hypothetical protein C4577_04290 [Candidatus Parcubacteria bacterium]